MVSASGGVPGNNDSFSPVISQDGRYVTFVTSANDLGIAPGLLRVDTASNSIVQLSSSVVTTLPAPSMSLDGRYVSYLSAGLVRVWDVQNSLTVYTGPSSVTSMALSPTGNQFLYQLFGRIYAVDLVTKSNLVSFDCKLPIRSSALWSTNGRFFAFVTASNDAFNRLYEFLGQKEINERLWRHGFTDARILRRLEAGMDPEENRVTNPFVFFEGDRVVYQALGKIWVRDLPKGTPRRLTTDHAGYVVANDAVGAGVEQFARDRAPHGKAHPGKPDFHR